MSAVEKKIMIIDDDQIIRDIIQEFLNNDTCKFFSLPDGQAALEIFHNHKVDLVICDMIMPNSDGIEVIQKIKLDNPEAKILGISGGGTLDYLALAVGFGASSILYKPFTRNELLEKIESIGLSLT